MAFMLTDKKKIEVSDHITWRKFSEFVSGGTCFALSHSFELTG
jgi:hypothetical protein